MADHLSGRRTASASRQEPRLIVGLGNPGARYAGTRHNVGAEAIGRLAELLDARLRYSAAKSAWLARIRAADREEDVVLARPNAFMNECGPLIARLSAGLGGGMPLIVSDDLDLKLGALRFRKGGSAGGHRGLASLIDALGTRAFPRLKIGIGRPMSRNEVTDYVLSRFPEEEREARDNALARAAEALRTVVGLGLERAMTEYSG